MSWLAGAGGAADLGTTQIPNPDVGAVSSLPADVYSPYYNPTPAEVANTGLPSGMVTGQPYTGGAGGTMQAPATLTQGGGSPQPNLAQVAQKMRTQNRSMPPTSRLSTTLPKSYPAGSFIPLPALARTRKPLPLANPQQLSTLTVR